MRRIFISTFILLIFVDLCLAVTGDVTVTLNGTNPLSINIRGDTKNEEAGNISICLYFRDDGITDLSLSGINDDQLEISWGWGHGLRTQLIGIGSWSKGGHTFTRRLLYDNVGISSLDDYWTTGGINALICTFSAAGNGHIYVEVFGADGLTDWIGDLSGHNVSYDNQTVDLSSPQPPEINIKQGNTNIANSGLYTFPSRNIGNPKDKVMTIENLGSGDLTITTPLNVTGIHADQFSISTQPAISTIPPCESTNFTIRFLPTSSGEKTAKIEIINNDADENPYFFRLVGHGDQCRLITSSDPTEGGITTPSDTSYHDYGTILPVTATAESGFLFTYWIGNVEDSTSAGTTVTMNQDQAVTAHFNTIVPEDTSSPHIIYCYPADGSLAVPKNTSIQFMIDDAGEGVDISSINAWVDDKPVITDGTAVSKGVALVQQSSSALNVTYLPETPFAEGSAVTVHVTCNDLGVMPNPCDIFWSFTTGNAILDTSTTVTGILGPDGGTLQNEALNVSLAFPEGALEDSVTISITAADSLPPLPEGQTGLGLSCHFGPDGLVANEPITVAIPYTQMDLYLAGASDPTETAVYYLHSATGEWTQLNIAHVDEVKQLIYVVVTEFCYVTLSGNITTDVQDADIRPLSFALYQNYPNPFNPESHIGFHVAEPCRVVLKVYNLLGHEVAALVNEMYQPGMYDVTFNADGMASGIYVYKIQMGEFTDMKKMTILE